MNVLLIHGLYDTGSIFKKLVKDLSGQGHPCLVPSLHPNDGRHGIADLASKLEVMVNEAFDPTEPFAVIGFSMGCLISRYYLHRMHAFHRTKAFFAISGPHRGTWLAYLHRGQGAREMRPGSDFLKDLDAIDETALEYPTYSYWTPLDLMIIPPSSSKMPSATDRIVWAAHHAMMPSHKRICADIIEKLDLLGVKEEPNVS